MWPSTPPPLPSEQSSGGTPGPPSPLACTTQHGALTPPAAIHWVLLPAIRNTFQKHQHQHQHHTPTHPLTYRNIVVLPSFFFSCVLLVLLAFALRNNGIRQSVSHYRKMLSPTEPPDREPSLLCSVHTAFCVILLLALPRPRARAPPTTRTLRSDRRARAFSLHA